MVNEQSKAVEVLPALKPVPSGAPLMATRQTKEGVFEPLVAPPGFPPDVAPGQVIMAAHINAIRDSVYSWPGDVSGGSHVLRDVGNMRIDGDVSLDVSKAIAFNGEWTDGWHYRSNGPMMSVNSDTSYINLYVAPVGVAGAAAATTRIARLTSSRINLDMPVLLGGFISTPLWQSLLQNVEHDGTNYRYRSAGAGAAIYTGSAGLTIDLAPSGSAGAIAMPVNTMAFSSSKIAAFVPFQLYSNIESPIDASNKIGHSFNLTWDGSAFRYVAANYGGIFRFTNDGAFRLAIAPTGSAGAVATTVDIMTLRAGVSAIRTDSMTLYPQTAGNPAYQYLSTSAFLTRWAISMSSDAAGNNFELARYTGASVWQDAPLSIANASGNVTLAKYLLLTTRTAAVDDAAAASAGVPVGGLYHNSGAVRIRLT